MIHSHGKQSGITRYSPILELVVNYVGKRYQGYVEDMAYRLSRVCFLCLRL